MTDDNALYYCAYVSVIREMLPFLYREFSKYLEKEEDYDNS